MWLLNVIHVRLCGACRLLLYLRWGRADAIAYKGAQFTGKNSAAYIALDRIKPPLSHVSGFMSWWHEVAALGEFRCSHGNTHHLNLAINYCGDVAIEYASLHFDPLVNHIHNLQP